MTTNRRWTKAAKTTETAHEDPRRPLSREPHESGHERRKRHEVPDPRQHEEKARDPQRRSHQPEDPAAECPFASQLPVRPESEDGGAADQEERDECREKRRARNSFEERRRIAAGVQQDPPPRPGRAARAPRRAPDGACGHSFMRSPSRPSSARLVSTSSAIQSPKASESSMTAYSIAAPGHVFLKSRRPDGSQQSFPKIGAGLLREPGRSHHPPASGPGPGHNPRPGSWACSRAR